MRGSPPQIREQHEWDAVGRGVLLRPLGDVVVLMPPLTVTPDEIVQIVDALVAGITDVMA